MIWDIVNSGLEVILEFILRLKKKFSKKGSQILSIKLIFSLPSSFYSDTVLPGWDDVKFKKY